MSEYFELHRIYWDIRANNGKFCRLKYYNHPFGCPNYPQCIEKNKIDKSFKFIACVIEEFDLNNQIKKMQNKFPNWSKKQCECVLYWQSSVKKRLKNKALRIQKLLNADFITLCPESLGVNVFGTMANLGIILYKNPKIGLLKKIVFIGVYTK